MNGSLREPQDADASPGRPAGMRKRFSPALCVFGLVALLHAAMLVFDVRHPAVFLNTDRAESRFATITALPQAVREGPLAGFLTSNGNPGDYLPQAVLYLTLGQYGLIVIQVALAMLAGYAVLRTALNVRLPAPAAYSAALLYMLLPHSLVLPHQLASEAIYTPMLAVSLWLLTETASTTRALPIVASGVVVGLANLVRPITLLWPVVAAALMVWTRPVPARVVVSYLAGAFVPVIAWMSCMAAATGQFSMGDSNRDLGHNLYGQVSSIIATFDPESSRSAATEYLQPHSDGSLPVQVYLRFAAEHPVAVAAHVMRATAVFAAKSGIERLTLDYLMIDAPGREELQDPAGGWRKELEHRGLAAVATSIWRDHRAVAVASAVGVLLMASLTLLAVAGAIRMLADSARREPRSAFAALIVVALPVYVFVFSQVTIGMQSRHRVPCEPALAILGVVGARWLLQRWRGRADARAHLATA